MKAPEYMTIKELKKILANLPDDYYACVKGGEDAGGEWAKLFVAKRIPDYWNPDLEKANAHMIILKY